MASLKAKFPVLQELFAKNHRVLLPPSGARVNAKSLGMTSQSRKPFIKNTLPYQGYVEVVVEATHVCIGPRRDI